VSTVCGAARAVTYSVSGSFGSFVPVLAQRMRCERAPKLTSRCQRSDAKRLAIGLVGALRDRDAELGVERGRHLVVHGDVPAAQEQRRDGGDVRVSGPPRHAARCRGCRLPPPRWYCSGEKSSVTLIGTRRRSTPRSPATPRAYRGS
jgi:hypothetical protein